MLLTEQIIIYVVFLLALTINLVAEAKGDETVRAYSKPLLMPLLIAYYLIMSNSINFLIVGALFCAFVGDVFLLFHKESVSFRLGTISFLFGHLFFIAYMVLGFKEPHLNTWQFLWPIIPAFLPAVVAFFPLRKHFKGYMPYAVIYMITGSSLLYVILLRSCCLHGLSFWLPFAGTMMFLVSDFFIAWTRFKKNFKYSGVIIMLTYVIAECFLVIGLM
jgi:uncharacterized membrane protein YhhN